MGRPWPQPGEPLFLTGDIELAIALEEQERAEAAEKCPLCGLPTSVCRDINNSFRFEASFERCHASYAIAAAQAEAKDATDVETRSTAWSAQLKKPKT